MKKVLLVLVALVMLTGAVNAQYPWWSGYYGMANPYFSTQPYHGYTPGYDSGTSYYQMYSPGMQSIGYSAYNYRSNIWSWYGSSGYHEGWSRYNPYGGYRR